MKLDRTFTQINTLLNNLFNGIYASTADLDQAESDVLAVQNEVDGAIDDIEALEALINTSFTEKNIGLNPASCNAEGGFKIFGTMSLTADTTTLFSNVVKLREFFIQIDNENANDWTITGIAIHFKEEELPDGMLWDSVNSMIQFPDDINQLYNISAAKVNGVFDAKIELR